MSADTPLNTLDAISPGAKPLFLSELGFYIAQAARSAYPVPKETSMAGGATRLRAFNEMLIVVMSELMALLAGREGRTNADLLQSLLHWASIGDCTADFDWALGKALHRL